ncbi:hypothetical protein AAA797_000215 [Vibrio parahaemolyticus]|nr:hypothetical protein [Vibrio parahaemolyticus]EJA3094071.1 hypothetical protein [Vibrio parahaemolyticus]ELH3009431.1 hypothetical protein [Vibrio parahaemolyticus]
MKLYFLVEGLSSEMQVYPKWIGYHLPNLVIHDTFDDFVQSKEGCYFFSGEGYPSILRHVKNAVVDIQTDGSVDYFFVILDSDEDTIESRKKEVEDELKELDIPERLHVIIVIQERCFETMLLGNRNALPRFPRSQPLIDYYNYYDASVDDPQNMGNYNDSYTHAQFHEAYTVKALRERRIRYTKSTCSAVATADYFEKICQRVDNFNHLNCLIPLISTLEEIRLKMQK